MSLTEAFRFQAEACEKLGSPFMGRLCRLFADRLVPGGAVADRMLSWPGDVTAGGQSLPLRIAGALHGLVLDGADTRLAAVYPPHQTGDADLWAAVAAALATHEARLMAWLDQTPQTNEVRRSAAMLYAAAELRGRTGLPLVISELGASAGLNLQFDRFKLALPGREVGAANAAVVLTPDWEGPLPPAEPVQVLSRAGVDLNPLDARDPDQALRLLAYLWPDQPDRLARTRAAIALVDAVPDAGDAADWLEARLAERRPGAVHLVYHTIAWQYFPPQTQARCRAALEAAGARADPDAPLAHLAMEADGVPGSAELSLAVWDGLVHHGARQELGRIDYHGRFVKISPGAR
ncbi:MAG: DUF2332 family protein [Pseudomonadota bacterium]